MAQSPSLSTPTLSPEPEMPNYPTQPIEEPQENEKFQLHESKDVVYVGAFVVTSEHYYKMLHQFHSHISQHFNVLPLLLNWVTCPVTGQITASIEIW